MSVLVFMLAALRLTAAQALPQDSPEFFETKVRPILANNCYSCHTNSALSGLRLDSLDAMKRGGKRGAAIIPGDPENSLVIQALRHTAGDGLKMPMGNKLKDADIEILAAWIKAGAVWPKSDISVVAANKDAGYVIPPERRNFWSFQPLKSPAAPDVKDKVWAKTPIDRFVLARLEQEGLKPVKAASKRDLLRRATLDLTGLPPTFEEISAFEKDASPDAFVKVVDRLLASPQYGERWGRIWLDVARFGEDDYRSLEPGANKGRHDYPNAYMYRDWVIQAFNDDMPYDQFVRAQIAGDLMDESVRFKMMPATGFFGLGPWYFDNGAVEVTRADERHDRVDVVTRGFLGLTVACARCHDHKYDPIPQKDYYAIAGVFYNTIYHEYPQVPKSVRDKYKALEDDLERKQKISRDMQTRLASQLAQSLAFETQKYLEAVYDIAGPQKKEMARVVEDRKLDFEQLDRWVKYMEKPTALYSYKKAWQEMMKRPNSTAAQATRLAQQFQDKLIEVMLARNEIDEENEIIADKALPTTKKKKRANKPNEFITNDDFCPGCGLQLKTLPEEQTNFYTEVFQRELDAGDDPMDPGARQKPGVLTFTGWGLEKRIGGEAAAMLALMRKEIEEAQKKIQPYFPFIHGVTEAESPLNIQLAMRGDPYNLGDEVPRHFLSVLSEGDPKPFTAGSGRMELADAILAQPLAMRVIVNRIWKAHFGSGVVDTPSNFGMAGERPTNPELLEYLAYEFAHNGLSIKKLHREIMLSSVYQLSTSMNEAAYEKDSGNRLYWRANSKRLDAEQIRDSILAVAGNLDKALGGPSEALTPSFLRRTVYGKVGRYKLDEYLQLFDFPSPAISAEKRFTTTVPLQRLFLMNSDFVQIEAEELAKRVANEANNRARVRKLYQLVYGREAAEGEIAVALEYLKNEPLTEFEEFKNQKSATSNSSKTTTDIKPTHTEEPTTTAGMPPDQPAEADAAEAGDAGMMAGVPGFGARANANAKPAAPEYIATPLGRYAKVLLSSSEFLFIN
jgi:mono/diheme cytochrome c family protein